MEEEQPAKPRFLAIIEWQVQSIWYELDSRTRLDYARQIHEIILRYPRVHFRWFDAEAWTRRFTDFSLCEFEDLDTYNSLWGELRRHPFLSTPFAFASRVVMGMELRPPEPLPQPPTPPSTACQGCGHNLKSTARFCGGCGLVNPNFKKPAEAEGAP